MKSHPKSEGTRRIKKPFSLSSLLLVLEFLVVWREEEEEEKKAGDGGMEEENGEKGENRGRDC